MNENQGFVNYVRTLQWWQSRFKENEINKPVFIPQKELSKWFTNPVLSINQLVELGLIEVVNRKAYDNSICPHYVTLEKGSIDISLIKTNGQPLNDLAVQMRDVLKCVSLPHHSKSTPYFDVFLSLRHELPNLFFTVDKFSGRIHTPITNLKKEIRSNILINGQVTKSIDVVTMQPLLLSEVLFLNIGNNEFTDWINDGDDIYLIIQDKANLRTRNEAKDMFYQILFSRPNDGLNRMFGQSEWIKWINEFKIIYYAANPNSRKKPHSNLAWLLQTTEVRLMTKVWQRLIDNGILFLTVHDEVILPAHQAELALRNLEDVLGKELSYFRLKS